MRPLMAFIGYLSTATVLTALLGLGYLWQTQRLDDEKVFRIVALVHDVDIDGLDAEMKEKAVEIPDEEPSLDDIEAYRAVFDRNTEVKLDALKRGSNEFSYFHQQLQAETDRFEEVAQKIGRELERQGELATKEAVAKVVQNLESIKAEEAKQLLLQTLDQPEGMKDVILLLNAMSPTKRAKILQKFREPNELEALHQITQAMLKGGPKKELIDQALNQLEAFEATRK